MPNTVIALKKSATPAAAPADLANGELAINYADGKLYYKNVTGQIVSIISGGNNFGTVNANNTLVVADTSGDVLTLEPGTNISIVGDAVNDKVTIGLQNDVVIPSTGTFKVAAVGGDEGGEIKLGNAITNSVLTGDIIIDIYQNRLRFFESTGTNRGAFINLAAAATGVGTDLLAAASSTDTVARNAAGAAFDKANTANITADLAYNHANAAHLTANAGFDQANTARTHANAAFNTANAALPNTSGVSFNGALTIPGELTLNANLNFNTTLSTKITDPSSNVMTFVTSQIERMRIDATGNVGIGTNNPTANLQVNGVMFITQNNTASLDVTGEIAEFAHNANGYTQIHIRNANTGIRASVDFVATADVGTDSTDFIDLGINNSGYADPSFTIVGNRDGYLYTSNGNIAIGTANTSGGRSVRFFTGGTLAANERARIDPAGNLLINRTTSTVGLGVRFDVNGAINTSAIYVNGGQVTGSLLRAPQILTAASGTYTTPAFCTKIYAELVGGGGAGGGIASATSTTGAPGGGAGSYCAVYATVTASTGYSYTVGAGGAGVSAAAGGNGGNTTLTIGGTVYRANGGTGGIVGSGTTDGGAGGLAAAGQLNVGGGGGFGGVSVALSGAGGASFLGGGGPSVSGGATGANATANGAGGSGASNAGVGANRAGGSGAAGIIRIWEFV